MAMPLTKLRASLPAGSDDGTKSRRAVMVGHRPQIFALERSFERRVTRTHCFVGKACSDSTPHGMDAGIPFAQALGVTHMPADAHPSESDSLGGRLRRERERHHIALRSIAENT